jgi:parallel beta-helix repeat protein
MIKKILVLFNISLFLLTSISALGITFNNEVNKITNKTLEFQIYGDTSIVPDDYPTIQEAIDNANNGDTIYVRNGIYHENVVIDKSINLIGEYEKNTFIDGNKVSYGVKILADWVNVSGFHIKNCTSGFYLTNSSFNTIQNVYSSLNTGVGIDLEYDSNNNYIFNSKIFGNNIGIILWNSSDNNVISCNVDNNYIGFVIVNSSNNEISNNVISNHTFIPDMPYQGFPGAGIAFGQAEHNILKNNIFSDNTVSMFFQHIYDDEKRKTYFDIDMDTSNTVNGRSLYYFFDEQELIIDGLETSHLTLAFCDNCIIRNCNISNGDGIFLHSSRDNTIYNTISSSNNVGINLYGSSLYDSCDNIISDCFFSDNFGGIGIHGENNSILNCSIQNSLIGLSVEKSYNKIKNNKFYNDGIYAIGNQSELSSHTVLNNTVNEKPLLYLINHRYLNINNQDIGQIILVNCSDSNINNINVSKTDIGFFCVYSENISINSSILSDSYLGFLSINTSDNSITNCSINSNSLWGIQLWTYSNNTIISDNKINGNQCGILSAGAFKSLILKNKIKDNKIGITFHSSLDNTIYLNNFIDNIVNANCVENYEGKNKWDDGKYGNYWDDYNGKDLFPRDGIGDTPYIINGGNDQDNYPLMKPYGKSKNKTNFQFHATSLFERFFIMGLKFI